MNRNKRGFTLIELLVVVLIIGILAAVAVPQYQKAVAKTRTTEAITMLKTLIQAEEAYFLANGEYTDNLDSLDVDVPTEQKATRWNVRNFDMAKYTYACHQTDGCKANTYDYKMPEFQAYYLHGTNSGGFTNKGGQACVAMYENATAANTCTSITNTEHTGSGHWWYYF